MFKNLSSISCLVLLWVSLPCSFLLGQKTPSRNVVLITMDGMRLEEVFNGADKRLMLPELGCKDPASIANRYWKEDTAENRRLLMPFLWSQIEAGGWIAGDVGQNSYVRVTNGKYFSYPGYNELLVGYADDAVDSNDKKYNKNVTVLEWLNRQPGLEGKVAAFCSWDVFPFIINDQRSGIKVNAGWQALNQSTNDRLQVADFLANHLFHEWDGVRYDAFTALGAIDELKTSKPRVLYLSLGETDDWAHAGRYDRYLLSAQQNDQLIKTVWETCQSMEEYRDNTTFIITSDHGRGDGREGWKSHSVDLPGSERIWVAGFGCSIAVKGVDKGGEFKQAQIASSVARAIGYEYEKSGSRIAMPLPIFEDN